MKLNKTVIKCALPLSAVVASGLALAATYYTDVEYYSDATYTTMVGEAVHTCRNQNYNWGTVTIYKRTVEKYDCSLPIP